MHFLDSKQKVPKPNTNLFSKSKMKRTESSSQESVELLPQINCIQHRTTKFSIMTQKIMSNAASLSQIPPELKTPSCEHKLDNATGIMIIFPEVKAQCTTLIYKVSPLIKYNFFFPNRTLLFFQTKPIP